MAVGKRISKDSEYEQTLSMSAHNLYAINKKKYIKKKRKTPIKEVSKD
ncbi:hypothetical protein MHK_002723 [Candidatus Magnetomorum sp. HK-1]|nr:hypothetical protein MHK_002723 [Candidatus Magnetomorum sp. HK-1]